LLSYTRCHFGIPTAGVGFVPTPGVGFALLVSYTTWLLVFLHNLVLVLVSVPTGSIRKYPEKTGASSMGLLSSCKDPKPPSVSWWVSCASGTSGRR
jgi:hypothetical protein